MRQWRTLSFMGKESSWREVSPAYAAVATRKRKAPVGKNQWVVFVDR